MAEAFTSYVVDNDKRFRKALDRVSFDIKDLRIPLTLIAKDFYRSERAIFQLQGPGQYPDLSKKPFFAWWETGKLKTRYLGGYKSYKQAKWGFAYPILKRTGRLADSVTNPSSPDAINRIENQNSLLIGTLVPYGIYHQSDRTRSRIPLRKFLFIGPESRFATNDQKGRLERWVGILEGFYAEKLKSIGTVTRHG
jgi:phage gpG-like protein